jgi:nucleoside 2-deoxyribosyltransferase
MEFDLNALRHSDLVIVNFNDPKSLGTCAELAIAKELHIPVIGINKDKYDLHPWLVEFTTRMCDDIREAVSHVVDFYLN